MSHAERARRLDQLVRDYKDPQLVCTNGCPEHGLICAWRIGEHDDPSVHRCIVTATPHEWALR